MNGLCITCLLFPGVGREEKGGGGGGGGGKYIIMHITHYIEQINENECYLVRSYLLT